VGQVTEHIEADNRDHAEEIAAESWQSGSWDGKSIIELYLCEVDEDDDDIGDPWSIKVEVGDDPEPPECIDDHKHDWQSPYEVVGGLKENPGVWATGGTTICVTQVCVHCGAYRKSIYYGAQREPGQCDTVEYEQPDGLSLSYLGL
jgi:hypothetical protein